MKKIFLFIAAILFGVTASFAQVDIVNVSWDATDCYPCESSTSGNYFKIAVSIFDNANSEWVVQNKTIYTPDHTYTNINVDVPEVDTYCNKDHDFTPSFTIYAWVWLIDSGTNPPSECCSGTDDYGSYNCHEFYSAILYLTPSITLN